MAGRGIRNSPRRQRPRTFRKLISLVFRDVSFRHGLSVKSSRDILITTTEETSLRRDLDVT